MTAFSHWIARRGWSFWTIIFIVAWFFTSDINHHYWMKDEAPRRGVIKHDVMGYYGYLPAIVIQNDPRLGFIGEPGFVNDSKYLYLKLDNGNRLIQYTSGLSILYSPFFLTAHAVAPLFGQERDGYNRVYQFFLVMSALFYVILALVFLRRLLLKYFTDPVTAITLLLVTLGTNIFYYTVYEGPMSHSYSFALIAIFLYLTDRWYARPAAGNTAVLGLVYGMITLVRPTNAMVLLLLILWGVKDFGSLRVRTRFLLQKTPLILLMILFFLIPWIPQLLYWKSVTGQFLYNSYDQVGSAFYFEAPQTHKMLFSYRKGWFIYTPIMLVAFTGFIFLWRRHKGLFWPTLVYMSVMIYLLSSWWAWWFGGGFGSRSMVDTYAIMAFPMAALWERILKERRLALLLPIAALVLFLVGIQLMQTKQYTKGSIHYVAMDKDAYWHNFFKIRGRGHWAFLSDPDHILARKGIYYYYDWNADYDAYRGLNEKKAKQDLREELTADKKMMRSIHRHARRNDLTDEAALQMVIDRIHEKKCSRKNLK